MHSQKDSTATIKKIFKNLFCSYYSFFSFVHLWFGCASYAIDCWPFKRRELVSGEHLNRPNQQLSIFLSSQNKLFHLYFFPSSIFFPPFFSFPFSCQPFCSLASTDQSFIFSGTDKQRVRIIDSQEPFKKASRHKSVLNVQGRKQRRKNLGSRIALLSKKFLRVQNVFARMTEKTF